MHDCLRVGPVPVAYWRGSKKLNAEDLGLNPDDVSDRLISLGHKRLLPKDALSDLALVEGRAQMAQSTDGLTGAEIEQVFVEALYRAFEQEEEPSDLTLGTVLVDFVPLSKLMEEQITRLRQWSKGRARTATSQVIEKKSRSIAG